VPAVVPRVAVRVVLLTAAALALLLLWGMRAAHAEEPADGLAIDLPPVLGIDIPPVDVGDLAAPNTQAPPAASDAPPAVTPAPPLDPILSPVVDPLVASTSDALSTVPALLDPNTGVGAILIDTAGDLTRPVVATVTPVLGALGPVGDQLGQTLGLLLAPILEADPPASPAGAGAYQPGGTSPAGVTHAPSAPSEMPADPGGAPKPVPSLPGAPAGGLLPAANGGATSPSPRPASPTQPVSVAPASTTTRHEPRPDFGLVAAGLALALLLSTRRRDVLWWPESIFRLEILTRPG
jgi:hypothetical protein